MDGLFIPEQEVNMASKIITIRDEAVKDIMHCAWIILEEAQHFSYDSNLKSLKIIGSMVWQITKALISLRRRL